MKFVLIVGPPAVGKMTVGQALAAITGLRLFHNHLSIELVLRFFDFGTVPFSRMDERIRFAVFEEVAKSDLPGLIFTLVWDFDFPEDADYVDRILDVFRQYNHETYIVELKAQLSERLKRNKHPDRIAEKPSKRDVDHSEKTLRYFESEYRMNSQEGEFPDKPRLIIDNTKLTPVEVAQRIKEYIGLE